MGRTKGAGPAGDVVAVTGGVEPRVHALYALDDVEAALGRGRAPSFSGDPCDDGVPVRHAALEALLTAGEEGRWRALARPTTAAVEGVGRLAARAPHMAPVIDLVVRRLRAATVIGLPVALPPLLLLGPPGVGKTWLMGKVAAELGVPFRSFAMNLATVGDTLSGSHTIWKATRAGLVATTLVREEVANPLFLVDELDKPPPASVFGDLYRPFHTLLEPEGARGFTDEHLGVPMDASKVIWVAAANAVDEIPPPIVDRLTVVEVGAMSRDDRRSVLRSVYAEANLLFRGFFDPDPAPAVLDRLADAPPRRARLAIEEAMARAAAEGRRTVRAADVGVAPVAPRPTTPGRRGMH